MKKVISLLLCMGSLMLAPFMGVCNAEPGYIVRIDSHEKNKNEAGEYVYAEVNLDQKSIMNNSKNAARSENKNGNEDFGNGLLSCLVTE